MSEQYTNKAELRVPSKYPVFFIGGSAGSVDAFKEILSNLPKDFSSPLFLILHRKNVESKRESLLPEILQNFTALTVKRAEDGEVIRSSHVYLPRHNLHISIEDNMIRLTEHPYDSYWKPSIDVLFSSAAKELENRAVCILITGLLNDGIEGLVDTTFYGGVTIAQLPSDAKYSELPKNAINRDHPNYVISLNELPELMMTLSQEDFQATPLLLKANHKASELRSNKNYLFE